MRHPRVRLPPGCDSARKSPLENDHGSENDSGLFHLRHPQAQNASACLPSPPPQTLPKRLLPQNCSMSHGESSEWKLIQAPRMTRAPSSYLSELSPTCLEMEEGSVRQLWPQRSALLGTVWHQEGQVLRLAHHPPGPVPLKRHRGIPGPKVPKYRCV